MVFYPSVKFYDDPSFVRRLAAILASNWKHVGASAASDLDIFWPVGSLCDDLPSCKKL